MESTLLNRLHGGQRLKKNMVILTADNINQEATSFDLDF